MQSRGYGCRPARKCHEAVTALLSEPTLKAAARRVGVKPDTLTAWQKVPEFAELLGHARQRTLEHSLTRLQAASLKAVAALERALAKSQPDPRLRVKAAEVLLGYAM